MSSQLENSKRIAKNTGYLYLRMFLVTIVNLFTSRVVLQALGFEDFGIYSVVGTLVILFSFLNVALKSASIRYMSYELGRADQQQLRRVFSMSINCHTILALLLLVVLEIAGVWFINHHLNISPERLTAANYAFHFSLLTFCISIIQTPFDACIIAHEKMNFYALISSLEAITKLAIAFLLMATPWDRLISYAALLALAALLVCGSYILYSRLSLRDCRYIRYWDKTLMRQYVGYSGWSLYVNAADAATLQGRQIFFNLFLGAIANAALGIANQVFNAVLMLCGNFAMAFNPQIIKSYAQGDRTYLTQIIHTASKCSYYLFILPTIPLLVNLRFVLDLWLSDYPPQTEMFIYAMFFFAIFDAFQSPLWNAILATGNIRTHQLIMGSLKLLVLPLTWLVLRYGDNGCWAILIWGIVNALCAAIRIAYAKHLLQLDVRLYLREVILPILKVTLLSLPVPVLCYLHAGVSWTAFFVTSILSVVIVLASVYGAGLTPAEKAFLHNLGFVQKLRRFVQPRYLSVAGMLTCLVGSIWILRTCTLDYWWTSLIMCANFTIVLLAVWRARRLSPFTLFIFTMTMLFIGGRFWVNLFDPAYDDLMRGNHMNGQRLIQPAEWIQALTYILLFLYSAALAYIHFPWQREVRTCAIRRADHNPLSEKRFDRFLLAAFVPFAIYTIYRLTGNVLDVLHAHNYIGLYADSNAQSIHAGGGILFSLQWVFFGLALVYGQRRSKILYLGLIILQAFVMIILGQRGLIGSLSLFCLWYYCYTHQVNLWKMLGTLLGITVLVVTIAQFSLRIDTIPVSTDIAETLKTTVFQQGVSITAFVDAMRVSDYPVPAYLSSFFPGVGTIMSIFSSEPVYSYQLSFSHYLSHSVNAELYSQGYGLGWSVLADFYCFSLATPWLFCVLSVLFGGMCACIEHRSQTDRLARTIMVTCMMNFFFLPRAGLDSILPLIVWIVATFVILQYVFHLPVFDQPTNK